MRALPVARPFPSLTPILTVVLATLATFAAGPDVAAQVPPGQEPAQVASVRLEAPDVELGEEFVDEEYGFSMRLPKGFVLLAESELAKIRAADIIPESEMQEVDGKKARVQIWMFTHPDAGNIYVKMNEPPVSIDSPTHLRGSVNEPDKRRGRPIKNVDKLYQFQARGARTGFLVSREFGLEPGQPTAFRQSVAYLRGTNRSFIVRGTAPIEKFDQLDGPFKASMVTFGIQRGKIEPVFTGETKAKETSLTSTRTFANIGLMLLLLFGGALAWKKSSVPTS